jgi:serine/threonine-protein kinase
MPETLAPGTVLSDRYTIETELGHGGMATVYRATDGQTREHVAVKVLCGELAQAIGAQRFAREIQIASALEHPNVVSLIGSGHDGDVVYCVMPLFEGETLRDRLDREKQLSVEDALDIAEAVANALDFAHARNPPIVHRDVKPENILLSDGRVGLADFGIARAVIQAEEGSKLTSTGVAVGTPLYMSPEQATADQLDHRTDVYALGCVLYEMLAGEPPFTGTQQVIIRKHALDPPPDLRTVRPGIPDPVWYAIERAMAKSPADRFKTAGEFVVAARRTASPVTSRKRVRTFVVAAVVVVGAIVTWLLTRPPAITLDSSLVAVLPFSLQAPDDSDRWLATAIPVSIAPLLEGTAGLTAVSERKIDEALEDAGKSWDDRLTPTEASRVARQVGAGVYLMGDVQSDGRERLVMARLYHTETGNELMDPVRVRLDTLGAVTAVDRIYGQILITLVDEADRASNLLTRSQEALRSYVEGWRARRASDRVEASRHFIEAFQADTTFALAAMGYLEVAMWLPDQSRYLGERPRAMELALAHRDQLSEPDQALLDAFYATTREAGLSGAETLEFAHQATIQAPDNASAWLLLGDLLLHNGAMLDVDDHVRLAAEAFDSALARSEFTPEAARHAQELRFMANDTAFIRQYVAAHPPDGSGVDPLWWSGIWLLGDSAAIGDFEARMDSLPRGAYPRIMVWAGRLGMGLEQADRAAALLEASPTVDRSEQRETMLDLHFYHINRGRPAAAWRVMENFFQDDRAAGRIFWLSQGGMADWIALDSLRGAVQDGYAGMVSSAQGEAECPLGMWHARGGDAGWARAMADSLEAYVEDPNVGMYLLACLAVIDAIQDTSANLAALRHADSLLTGMPAGMVPWATLSYGLTLAELYEIHGRYADALRLSKRVRYLVTEDNLHTPALVMEGRLSLATGDTARAIEAYTRALALLSDPEPPVERVTQEIRETLATLLAR